MPLYAKDTICKSKALDVVLIPFINVIILVFEVVFGFKVQFIDVARVKFKELGNSEFVVSILLLICTC